MTIEIVKNILQRVFDGSIPKARVPCFMFHVVYKGLYLKSELHFFLYEYYEFYKMILIVKRIKLIFSDISGNRKTIQWTNF